jgi:pyrimidine operon attenuation protein / uracil phosphoribosyltransferase
MILNASSAQKKLRRMALEIAERNEGSNEMIIIGIKENGIFIAKKIEEYLKPVFSGTIKTIALSLNKKNPDEVKLSEEISLNNKLILLVDDVANSGKTMLYALKPLLQQHPLQIQTLVLVERTHKLFPIALNFVGLSVSTTMEENIVVTVKDAVITDASITNQ